MKISTRLSFIFSFIASFIFIGSGAAVFYFSSFFQKNNFKERLKKRIDITEKIFLEKESFTEAEFEKIKEQFLHTLPEETEEVAEILNNKPPDFKYDYPSAIKDKFILDETFYSDDFKKQIMSKKFHVKAKDYVIIVQAIDQVGIQHLSNLRFIIAILILLGVPIFFIGSYFIVNQALLPLSKKIDQANTIGASNLHLRLEVVNPNDEIGKLAVAFNNLLNRLEDSFESQKSFIRNASHEIRNPLTAIMGEAEIAISKSRSKEEYIKSISIILKESDTLNSTVNNLLQLSRVSAEEGDTKLSKIDLVEFIQNSIESYNFINPENKIENKVQRSSPAVIAGNMDLLNTAIINLIDNACKFSSNQKVEISLEATKTNFILKIKDSGIGIAKNEIKKIETPFYRGNNTLSIKGSGIGFSLSSKIINLHHGTLSIISELNIGTEVIVKVPKNNA